MESKLIHRKFILTMVLFAVLLLAMVGVWIILLFQVENLGIVYAVGFLFLLILLFVSGIFKSRIESLTNLSFLARIKENASDPLHTSRLGNIRSVYAYLKGNGYTLFSDDEDHVFLYKVRKDDIKKVFKGYILEVVVFIKNHVDEYYLDIVDEEIHKVIKESDDKKLRVDKMLITQIREVEDLTQDEKDKVKEVVFIRTRNGVISTINVAVIPSMKKAVLLYSDRYTPSMYYTYHIEQIKKLV